MLPTTTEIARRLDDLISHAGVWSRLLLERARRLEGAEESAPELRDAAATITEGARAFRSRATNPAASPFDLLRAADRVLSGSRVLREALEGEREAAIDPDDASWLTHEIRALDRAGDARRGLIVPPPPGETPAQELRALQTLTGLIGAEILIEFETYPLGSTALTAQIGAGGAPDLPEPLEAEIAERAIRLADPLIRCEIPDWTVPPGANGRIRISCDEAPWLDAVDHAEDWLLERTIDLDTLAEMSWDEDLDPDEAPQP